MLAVSAISAYSFGEEKYRSPLGSGNAAKGMRLLAAHPRLVRSRWVMKIWHKVVISTVVGVLAYRLMTNVDEDILGWIAGVLIGLVVYLAIGLAGRTFIWSEPLVPHVSSSRKTVALVLWCREVIRPLRTRAVQVLRVLAAIYVGLAAQTLVSNAFFHSQYVQILAAASSLGLAAGLMYWVPTATEPQPPAGGQHVDTC